MAHASATMERGLLEGLHLKPLLPKTFAPRVINVFELHNPQFETIRDTQQIQDTLQEYGAFVSVKQMGKGCHDCYEVSCEKSCCYKACIKEQPQIYIRVSSWSYTSHQDFDNLNLIFENNLSLSTTSTKSIRNQFIYLYDLYERLFSVLKTEAFFKRAERLRHHPIFYYAHTAVFYVNKLVVSGFLDPRHRIDPKLESVMSVGVDEMSWDDYLEDNYEWTNMTPDEKSSYLGRIRHYREQVKDLVLRLLDTSPIVHPIAQGSLHWVILMGISHECIHLETSACIISQVPLRLLQDQHNFNFPTYYGQKTYREVAFPEDAPSNTLIRIPGKHTLEGNLW